MFRTALVAALLVLPVAGHADDGAPATDLTSIDLEDLMRLTVTSVSRREEPHFRAASAVTVLTADDIARSGASNIPDLLRIVPGMNVAQINTDTWAVSARGFNGQYANKMLVLVDGRTVYSPVFSGVYWDVLDVVLEDVERIEVIRGPGATAWGANAVNGVINIITKPAGDTREFSVTAGGGSRPARFGSFNYAAPAGDSVAFRVFAKYQGTHRQFGIDGLPGHDALGLLHSGGRMDWHGGRSDALTLQADVYDGRAEQRSTLPTFVPPYSAIVDADSHVRGGSLMASWRRTFSATSDLRLDAFVDHAWRPSAIISENLRTFEVGLHHRLAVGPRHDLMWGGGYRAVDMVITGSTTAWFNPPERATHLANLFVQDAIAVWPRRVTLTLGSKFEDDGSTSELEPSARLLWAASPTQTVWGAVSRAARTPGPADNAVNYNLTALPLGGGAVGFTRLIGTDMRAEILTAGELGYRALLAPRLSLDLAAYEGRYTHVRVVAPGAPFLETSPAPDHMVFPLYFVNGYHARTRGLEGGLDWRPGPRFHLTVSHTVFWMRLDPDAGVVANPDVSAHDAPTYQLAVRPHLMLAPRLGFDATWYHVDDVPAQRAPAYDRLDAQLSWRTPAGFELTAGVQNVFHDRDLEFVSTSGTNTPTTVRTGAYGKVTWRP